MAKYIKWQKYFSKVKQKNVMTVGWNLHIPYTVGAYPNTQLWPGWKITGNNFNCHWRATHSLCQYPSEDHYKSMALPGSDHSTSSSVILSIFSPFIQEAFFIPSVSTTIFWALYSLPMETCQRRQGILNAETSRSFLLELTWRLHNPGKVQAYYLQSGFVLDISVGSFSWINVFSNNQL